jgi:glycerol-3-phosphate dehydrogenase subunit B
MIDSRQQTSDRRLPSVPHPPRSVDTLIIGAGLAGLTAAWQLAVRRQRVRLIAKGWGATHWSSGCIDLLGYYPVNNTSPIEAPVSTIARLSMEQPNHPYAQVSLKQIDTALKTFQTLCAEAGYPLKGSIESNWLLPSAAGSVRPTCLAPETFLAGDLTDPSPMLLVGIEGFNDFFPHLAAANLEAQNIPAEAIIIQIPGLHNRKQLDAMVLARYFDDLDTTVELVEALKPHLGNAERIGFPAILGTSDALGVVRALESLLGRRVFEIPGLPPSVPGMRLHKILVEAIQKSGGQVFAGMEAVSGKLTSDSSQIEAIYTEAAARPALHTAGNFILATGGILGGGIHTNHTGAVYDPIFDLPVQAPSEFVDWLQRDFLHPDGHPILGAGVLTSGNFKTEYENLFVIGSALPGDFVRERSLEGVALVGGYQVGEVLA